MSNVERFPSNIFDPVEVKIKNYPRKMYRANFRSLYDLRNYLTNNPEINHNCFPRLASEREGYDFAGESYEDTLKMIDGPIKEEFADFFTLQKKIDRSSFEFVKEYVSTKSVAGGVIDIPSLVTGSPLCYVSEKEVFEPKFIRLNLLLSYYCGTSKSQVKNRALIVTALINALEREGYVVDVNTFAVSKEGKELMNINVNIKNSNQTLNKANLIKSLCYVEFFRRLIFRVKETLDVKDEEWGDGYGVTCDKDEILELLKLSKDDIFVDQPRELCIYGRNLVEDFDNAVKFLGIGDKIDVKESRDNIKRQVKVLSKNL